MKKILLGLILITSISFSCKNKKTHEFGKLLFKQPMVHIDNEKKQIYINTDFLVEIIIKVKNRFGYSEKEAIKLIRGTLMEYIEYHYYIYKIEYVVKEKDNKQ